MLSLRSLAVRNPAGIAVETTGGSISFANLFDKSETIAAALGFDLEQNDQRAVAFVAHNDLATIALFCALLERGIAALPLHPRSTSTERRYLVDRAKARMLEPSDLGFRDAVTIDGSPRALQRRNPSTSLTPNERRHPADAREPTQLLIATSGSTGAAKLVCLTQRALEAAARASGEHLGLTSADRWLLSLNLAHIGGISILIRCFLHEARVVLAEPGLPAAELAHRAECAQATLASFVPTQLERLLALTPCPRLASLRAILVGGAKTPLPLARRAREAGWPILLTYGLSEAGSQVTTQPLTDLKVDSVSDDAGLALPGMELKIEDSTIFVRGPALFQGYLGEESSPFSADGWFQTSDLGKVNADGRLVPLGRRDDCIVTGGEKVSCLEVEGLLLDEPDVRAAKVVGLPDATWGQVVAAVLVLQPPADPVNCLPQIQAMVASRLAPHKRPKRWLVLPELPQLPSGKLDRRAILAVLAESIGFSENSE
jgi:O-succinylbenzoic acid--CoA ligase